MSVLLGLFMAAQAWYFTACVTVNLPDDDRSDTEAHKLQSRVNRHSEVSAIFHKHGQSGFVMHWDTPRARVRSKDKDKEKAGKSSPKNHPQNPSPGSLKSELIR